MTVKVDSMHFANFLNFCSENAPEHGELSFDGNGMTGPKAKPFSKLPFSTAQFTTYSEYAQSEGYFEYCHGDAGIGFKYFKLSPKGHTFITENHVGWWKNQFAKLGENILTVVISVVIAVAASWAAYFFGPKP